MCGSSEAGALSRPAPCAFFVSMAMAAVRFVLRQGSGGIEGFRTPMCGL
jgi:hypothetical protein